MLRILNITVFFLLILPVGAQPKYCIDIEPPKNRRVPVAFYIEQTKENAKISKELRVKHRTLNKKSKEIRKHTYSIQTKKVKRRMRNSKKQAEKFNRGKRSMRVKLKKYFRWMK